jgi:hypothetical protein
MESLLKKKEKQGIISNSTLLIGAFASAFFPRVLTYFGAPAPLNFAHFIIIPIAVFIAVFSTNLKNRKQKTIVWELVFGLGLLFTCILASALINQAGFINVLLEFMFFGEAYIFLIGLISIPITGKTLEKFRFWISAFCFSNLGLALIQSVLLPIGLYPGARGGQLWTDNTAGVFASPGGSAGNYISATVSIYFAFYFLQNFPQVAKWIRVATVIAALYQTYVSDSKQIFVALFVGWLLVVWTNMKQPAKLLLYLFPIVIIAIAFYWALVFTDWEFLDPYRNFTINRTNLYGPDGEGTLLKTAAFRIVPSFFTSPLNWFLGLGPGHTASRLGGWVMNDYRSLLIPLGATIHPATGEFWKLILGPSGWPARESTMWFPMFTWVGLWGDLGLIGLVVYLYVGAITWLRLGIDNYCKFLILSTAVLGFILTQMEEPGQMLTVACFLGLRWHEQQQRFYKRQMEALAESLET